MHYREVDLTRVRTVPVGNRPTKVDTSALASVPAAKLNGHPEQRLPSQQLSLF